MLIKFTNKNNYKIDFSLLFFISILFILKLILLKSSSVEYKKFFIKSITNIILSILIMFIASFINYRIYEKYSFIFYIINLFLIILVFFISNPCKGSYRWLNFKILKFQVSELFKISIPLLISSISYRYKNKNQILLLFLYLLLIFLPALLIIIQPDLGTSILIIISGFLSLFFSGLNILNLLIIILVFLIFSIIYYNKFMYTYQKNRILTLFSINEDIFGSGYHILQSKIAIGSGGFLGKGVFNSTQSKLNFIPESHTDFIFSILAEEFGLLGVIFLLLIYLFIIIKCFLIAIYTNNRFKKILVSSLTSSIFINIFINIGMVSGILPIVGIPLPFLSYGGSSLIILLTKIGIIMSMKYNKIF